ncbi:MAG: serine protease [Rhodopirellula sp.]|nr:serine protease [Rhodopirellula sp.]
MINLRTSYVCSLLLLGLAFSTGSPSAATEPIKLDPALEKVENSRIESVARAVPSAVSVFVPGGGGGGSGVMISPDGYALTNFHVTSPAGSFMRCGMSDGNVYDAVIVGIDPVGDLAMIRLLGRSDFPKAELGDSRAAEAGDWCMVIGNPFLLATNLKPTVTYGILSGVGRYQYPSGTLLEYGDCLQTDASVNPGNSGGPIYDAEGKLLGIVGRCSFEKRGRVNVGVGYAISINQAKNFLGYLRSGRIVDHATLGATVSTEPDGGVVVSNILESSDAYRRGLRYGSEILEIDGRVVQTANDLQNVMATLPNGWRVKLSYRSEGKTVETLVRMMGVHLEDELLKKMAGALPPPPPRPQQPDPEDKDSDQKDKPEKNENQPPQRAPRGQRPGKPPVKIPQEVKEQLVERKGFANYHFNLAEQNAFIDALRNQFPATEKPGQPPLKDEKKGWLITGETDQTPAEPVKIQTTADKMSLQIGQKTYEIDKRSEMYDVVTDGTVAGLLPALDAWRRMLIDGPQKFGESYYLGTMPLGGERPLRDVMVGIAGELEIRWLSHPDTGAVEAIEVFADRDEDPAELWLLREPNAKAMPSVLDLRYGTDSILKVKVKSWKEVPASELEWSAEKKNANNTGNLNSKRAVGALQNTTDKNEVKA